MQPLPLCLLSKSQRRSCTDSPQAEQGGLSTVGRHGAAINVDFVAGSTGQITIELDGSDSNFPDVNPILNAFTLEREPGDDRPLELHLNTAATTGTFTGADPGEGLDFIGQFTCKTAMLSRFVTLAVSLTRKASLLQTPSTSRAWAGR